MAGINERLERAIRESERRRCREICLRRAEKWRTGKLKTGGAECGLDSSDHRRYEAEECSRLFDEDTHRVYLAGPDVFFPDAKGRGEMRKKWCNEAGLEGVYPLDSGVDLEGLNPMEKGFAIYDANIELILSCEGVLADITPFRGPSADVGTAFEIGFGKALGLPIVCYTNEPNNYKDRVQDDGLLIEDFGMVDNLMLHGAAGDDIYLDFNLAAHALYRLLR